MDLYGIYKTVTTIPKNGGQGGEGYTTRAKVALFINPDLGGRKGVLGAPLHPDRFQKMWIFHISSDSPEARACGSRGCSGRKGVETHDRLIETRAKDSVLSSN